MKQLLILLIFVTIVAAQTEDTYATRDGMVFNAEYNKHGVVLSSQKSYNGSHIVIYVGKECDVYSREYGKGRWDWTNAGCCVFFNEGPSFIFPHQVFDVGSNGCAM